MSQESLVKFVLSEEEQYRANAYRLLAALLRVVPEQATLAYLAALPDMEGSGELGRAFADLGRAARGILSSDDKKAQLKHLDDEFHSLFIGLSRGEIVPYGSWYQSGFLMEKPLGQLRENLSRLGIERVAQSTEPEDHIAAVLESFALLIEAQTENKQQLEFFQQHIDPWAEQFFNDLAVAPSASFYQRVAQLGIFFVRFENLYLRL